MERDSVGRRSLLGELIAHERRRRSLSREELAALVRRADRAWRTHEKTIRRWETGGEPQPAALRALAVALGRPVEELVGLMRQAPNAGNLPDEEDEETERRAFLTLLAAAGSGMIDLERLATPTVDDLYMRDAEGLTASLLDQWYTATPAVLLPPAVGHLGALQRALPGPPALENLTGRTAVLVAHLFDKINQPAHARTQYALAESLARDTRDDDLLALVLVLRSGLHSWRRTPDRRRGFALVSEASATIGPTSPPLLRTLVVVRMAEEHAAVGDLSGFQRDMARAESTLRPGADHWYGPRDSAELAAVRGASEMLLGRHRDAADTLSWTLERMNPSAVNWRAVVASDRDRALAAL
jgi:transcriptional regulator with XRE-family HTH domain